MLFQLSITPRQDERILSKKYMDNSGETDGLLVAEGRTKYIRQGIILGPLDNFQI